MAGHKRRHRLLNQIKAASRAPVRKFAESMTDSTIHDVSLWEPPGGSKKGPQAAGSKKGPQASSSPCTEKLGQPQTCRASGKTGATWSKDNAQCFLKLCLPFKVDFRKRVVPTSVWQTLSDQLYDGNLDYSPEQLKEKMRNLKRAFGEAKRGQHLGDKWEYFSLMRKLFDCPMSDAPDDSCIISGGSSGIKHWNDENELHPAIEVLDHSDKVSILNNSGTNSEDENANYLKECEVNCDMDRTYDKGTSTNKSKTVPPMNHGKTYIVSKPMFQHKTSEVNDIDFSFYEGNPADMTYTNGTATDASETILPRNHGKTYIVTEPMFQHQASDMDDIGLNTSLLSLRNDAPGPDTTSTLRSPSRKKLNSKVSNSAKRTPEKTPKRKVAQSSLLWPTDVLQLFLQECVKRKAEVSLSHPPLSTWKDISAELGRQGHNQYNWEICRAKFETMLSFYRKTLIPAGGIVCGVKSRFYDDFCKIFDVGTSSQSTTGLWDIAKTKLLLSLYKEKKEEFDSSRNRHAALFEEISNQMALFDLPDRHPDGKQCMDHFDALKQKFRTEYDLTRGTGNAPSTWIHFDQMMDIYEGCVTLEPPRSLSVGTTTEHLLKGKPLETGAIPKTVVAQPKSSKNQKPKKMTKATWQQVKLDQSASIAEELRLSRLEMDKRSEARWQDFMQLMRQNKSCAHHESKACDLQETEGCDRQENNNSTL